MAFLCPVRIRRGKKKKPLGIGSGGDLLDNKDLSSALGRPSSAIGVGGSGSSSGLGGLGGAGGGTGSGGGGGGTLSNNHGMGRITGSASIETLVRVGIEKEHGLSPDSKMVVLHDFTPCVDDELEVKRGQCVNILYRENDWVYVIGQDTRQEGFIPHSYCAPYNTQLADLAIKKKLPRGVGAAGDLAGGVVTTGGSGGGGAVSGSPPALGLASVGGVGGGGGGITGSTDLTDCIIMPDISADLLADDGGGGGGGSGGIGSPMAVGLMGGGLQTSQASLSSEPDFLPFAKDPSGRYIVLYTFIARDENDVSVERGEFVTVLNREDPEWFWIVRSDGQEGFIPSGFVYPADNVLQENAKLGSVGPAGGAGGGIVGGGGGGGGHGGVASLLTDHHLAGLNQSLSIAICSGNNNNNHNGSSSQLGSPTGLLPTQQHHMQQQQQQPLSGTHTTTATTTTTASTIGAADDQRYHGTELVMLYDYKAQAPDDLSVRRGDWIYADLNNQTVDGWLWAYAPKTRKYGFIPKAYARPPAMTSL